MALKSPNCPTSPVAYAFHRRNRTSCLRVRQDEHYYITQDTFHTHRVPGRWLQVLDRAAVAVYSGKPGQTEGPEPIFRPETGTITPRSSRSYDSKEQTSWLRQRTFPADPIADDNIAYAAPLTPAHPISLWPPLFGEVLGILQKGISWMRTAPGDSFASQATNRESSSHTVKPAGE